MMTTELVLLMIISFLIWTPFMGGLTKTFKEEGVPAFAIRLEKHVMTGYLFSQVAEGSRQDPDPIEWEKP